jgi:putative endonuclease
VSPLKISNLTRNNRGKAVEDFVACFLEKHDFRLLSKNFRSRFGEIDLIGIHQNQLVFLEVRFRASIAYGGAAASVTKSKQRKLIQTARFFLLQAPQFANKACRFDVAAVTLSGKDYAVEWIQHAFY